MNNITITFSNRQLSISQNTHLNQREIMRELGVNVVTNNGQNLTNNATLDLSRINPQVPGTYYGSVNVTDPNTGESSFANFTIVILPNAQNQSQKQTQQATKKPNKRKKILLIIGIILLLILGITACHQHQINQENQAKTAQQVKQNKQGIKNNKEANQAMQKQLDDLKKAQDQYNQDHDKQAYQNKLADLESENQNLKDQINNSALANRVGRLGDAINSAANNPDNGDQNYQNASQQAGMNGLWSKIKNYLDEYLNN